MIYPPTKLVPVIERWRLEDCNPKEVLFVGRFDRHKGGDLIIEAFRSVLREVPQARLRFVGPDMGYTNAQNRRWSLRDFVHDRLPGALESGHVVLLGHQPFSSSGLMASASTDHYGLFSLRERSPFLDRGHVPGLPDRGRNGRWDP